MAIIDINKNPSQRELTWFGVGLVVFTAIVGALILHRTGSMQAAVGVWTFGGLLSIVYHIVPQARIYIYLGWLYAAMPIGWTLSHVAMAIVFYLVVTPIGVTLRMLGRHPIERAFDRSAPSYWKLFQAHNDARRYFQQF